VERRAFDALVADALAGIPSQFRDALANLAISVESEPAPTLLREMEIEPPDTLLGLYQGTPLTERGSTYGNALPDRILLFQGPLERASEDADDMVIRKRFGQHFLEPAWVVKVVHAIAPAPDDVFFEIGPGRGALTRELSARAKAVTAFEIDRDLAADLRQTAPDNLNIVEGDFLTSGWILANRPLHPVRVAGNLPYNVASPILFKLMELYTAGIPLTDATVMLQREVADRLAARPGSKEYGVLSVLIRLSADVERLLVLPAGAFRPAPKVQSALVRLRFRRADPAPRNGALFSALVQAIFTRRRKTLANAILAFRSSDRTAISSALDLAGIDGRRRPETLDIHELVRLADTIDRLPAAGRAVL
jgi:16S rRNA (adenine1518-N6/adenine1519-N6)-dimethyltransferase